MKTISNIEPVAFESTYALIVRSEEKQRSRFEILIYSILIANAFFAIAQFGREVATIPLSFAQVSTTASSPAQGNT